MDFFTAYLFPHVVSFWPLRSCAHRRFRRACKPLATGNATFCPPLPCDASNASSCAAQESKEFRAPAHKMAATGTSAILETTT